ncbi:hypothetical protein HPP92_006107 [Vanilla planifolia]|uniref:Importin N-terminal domain-containing protein n=1 Tax=Vanilla planifolia TaxID=51239 RepID=A0A835RJQ9_VANPL|nr:hypothetical protein HPP92_006107 [Vanilla planifolia]
MDQQVALVLGADLSHFEALISQLMSSANDQRSQAEALFNLCRERHPDALVLKLGQVLHSSQPLDIRAMSAVLLRKQLASSGGDSDESPSYVWTRLNPATQSSIKSILLSAVQREETKSLSSSVTPFRSLLPTFSPMESSLLIFSQLAQYIGDMLLPHLPTLHSVFLNSLSHSVSPDVRIAALGASVNFVQCIESTADRERFQDLLPAMMRTLTEALNSGNEANAQEALELLIELAGTEPRFLRRQLVDVVGYMLQIAEDDRLEEGTRHLAVEFVSTLAESRERAPGMMRRLPQFIGRLFAVLMKMLLDIEDEPAWHCAESEDEDAGETSNYSVGQECLDRLSIALGGNTIVPVASELLPQYLAAPEWQKATCCTHNSCTNC